MTLAGFVSGEEGIKEPIFNQRAKQFSSSSCKSKKHKNRHHRHRKGPTGPTGATGSTGPTGPTGPFGPLGSYYVDASSQNIPQTIVLPSPTGTVQFSGTNANNGVTLSLSGDSIIIPVDGTYTIDWNIAVSKTLTQSMWIDFHLDLQKNGTTLLNPSPQAQCFLANRGPFPNPDLSLYGTPYISAAAAVTVSLSATDEISLLLTIDGAEGSLTGDGVQINSAQISATWNSP